MYKLSAILRANMLFASQTRTSLRRAWLKVKSLVVLKQPTKHGREPGAVEHREPVCVTGLLCLFLLPVHVGKQTISQNSRYSRPSCR
ncbi:hypothetical protein RRG08_020584 [Elysia crispata]|uniref:Uncharacterized protein n=1 Tax=Elysia crispata TaxID=231223 RepID=A0AAE1A6J9_9GAST|nr:hypothetical protein RRG08_020584 [Elysia crispata]